jgi:hypothetical protein
VIVALLSYFREPDSFLKQMVKSLPRVGVDRLIALDGAYARFPGGTAHSPRSNRRVLERACESASVDLWHVAPDDVWAGDEIEKRSVLFTLAESITTPDDWYLVVDGDEQVTHVDGDVPALLNGTDRIVAECELYAHDGAQPLRMFFKAERGLRPVGTHFTYGLPDGRIVWGGYGQETEQALTLPVRVLHKTLERSTARRNASLAYYKKRDEALVEDGPCAFCGQQTAHMIPYGWHPAEGGLTAQRALCCKTCLKPRLRESVMQAAEFGVDATPQLDALVV